MAKKETRITVRLSEHSAKKLDEAKKKGYSTSDFVNDLISKSVVNDVDLRRKIIIHVCKMQSELEFEEDPEIKKELARGVECSMSLLKFVPQPYDTPDVLRYLIHGYVFPKAKLYGGLSVDPHHAAEQMLLVKELWHQTEGKQLRHFVLCFDEKESADVSHPKFLWAGACSLCDYFAAEYQIVFGIHEKYGCWHIHFVVNNISYTTGKRFPEKNTYDYQLANYIPSLTLPTNKVDVVYR